MSLQNASENRKGRGPGRAAQHTQGLSRCRCLSLQPTFLDCFSPFLVSSPFLLFFKAFPSEQEAENPSRTEYRVLFPTGKVACVNTFFLGLFGKNENSIHLTNNRTTLHAEGMILPLSSANQPSVNFSEL